MAAAQTTFEAVAKEYGTAKERLEMAQKSGLPGAAQVAEAALAQTKAKLERASAGFQKAEKELQKASKTKREQEVALAESAKTRDIRERLFDSAGKTGDFDADADEEAKRLAAVITLQRAWRRYARKRTANRKTRGAAVRGLLGTAPSPCSSGFSYFAFVWSFNVRARERRQRSHSYVFGFGSRLSEIRRVFRNGNGGTHGSAREARQGTH